MVGEGDERCRLCGSIGHCYGEVYAVEESLHLLIEGRAACYYLVGVATEHLGYALMYSLPYLLAYHRHVEQQTGAVVLYLREYALAHYLLYHEGHSHDKRRLYGGKRLGDKAR